MEKKKMKNKVPIAKCEKCSHLKIMTEEKVIICDYLNAFHKALFTMAWNKPYRCPNYEPIKKIKSQN